MDLADIKLLAINGSVGVVTMMEIEVWLKIILLVVTIGYTLAMAYIQSNSPFLKKTAAWTRKEGKNPEGGLNEKGVQSYRKENPGSNLQTAVTTPPSELKKGSKAWNRRKSFCARMKGVKGPMKKPNGEPTRKALALKKWNC